MESLEHRLVWFELEVCPHKFRFTVVPGQPVLFGYRPDNGKKSKTILVPYDGNEELVDSLIESLDALVRSSRIFETPPNAPERAFRDDTMRTASIHIRIAYANNKRWASVYALKEVPTNVRALVEQSKQLGLGVLGSLESRPVSGEMAMELVRPDSQVKARKPSVVAKVKVTLSWQICLNGAPVSLAELGDALNHLKEVDGEVWYSRECPEEEPSPEVGRVVESVLNIVAQLRLPIRLSETDFD